MTTHTVKLYARHTKCCLVSRNQFEMLTMLCVSER